MRRLFLSEKNELYILVQAPEEIESDTEIEYEDDYEQYDLHNRCKSTSWFMVHSLQCCSFPAASRYTDQDDFIPEEKSDRYMMRQLPEEEKAKINEQIMNFRLEKKKLELEFAKWDDSGNDIIVVAKKMCMIMMEMTDFTRYAMSNVGFPSV
jgi:catenin alpha